MSRTENEPKIAGSKQSAQKICGIVMPIAGMGDVYPEDHWRRVRKIIQRAIERADMKSQLVWENAEVDVIQSAILQNIYESDVVICDLSGLNPNVMLETGLRLSTKKPTIIITDRHVKPPFDVSTIGYIEYQKDLEYNAIEDFIERLHKKIIAVSKSYSENNYKSFVENFTFETVTPSSVSVSIDDYLKDQIESLSSAVRRIEINQSASRTISMRPANPRPETRSQVVNVRVTVPDDKALDVEFALDALAGFGVSQSEKLDDNEWSYTIPVEDNSRMTANDIRFAIYNTIEKLEATVSGFRLI